MDFVHDQLSSGRKFRVLTVIDKWHRQCVALHADNGGRSCSVQRRLLVSVFLGGAREILSMGRWLTSAAAVAGGFLMALATPARAEAPAATLPDELRAARANIVGPAIASTPNYSVHSPQARKAGDRYQCATIAASPMSAEEWYAQRSKLTEAARPDLEAASNEQARLISKQHDPSFVKDAAYLAQLEAADKRASDLNRQLEARLAAVDKARMASHAASTQAVTLYLLHTPSTPDQTIVPFEGLLVSSAFVAELNRVLRPFLATCTDSASVSTAHYYRDELPFGLKVTADSLDPAIVVFHYVLRGGSLSLKPGQITSEAHRINNDPARNSRLTLAGLRASNAALAGESSRRGADYRKDHQVAARRKPGVVYKLDAYWQQYPNPELARRIFDGDFGGDEAGARYVHGGASRYADTAEFRLLFVNYAGLYSVRCKAYVKSWATLREQTHINHRAEWNPVTGSFEPKSDAINVTDQLDSRFAGLYASYRSDATKAFFAKKLGQLNEIDRGKRKHPGQWTSADFKDAVAREASEMMDMAGIFPSFFSKHACDSATMNQLGENILRAAHGRPSMQQAGLRLTNAERESDRPLQ